MLKARYAALALIPLLCAGYLACTSENTGDNTDAVAQSEENAVRLMPPIIGTFRDEGAAGGLASLTLKTDWTFHLEEAVVCVRYPCELPEVAGRYNYVQRDRMSILVLRDESGAILHQLDYTLRGDTLYIRPNGTSVAWQGLKRSDRSWCGEPRDCALQSLPTGECRGSWTCATNVCSFRCGLIGSEPIFAPPCHGDDCPLNPDITGGK